MTYVDFRVYFPNDDIYDWESCIIGIWNFDAKRIKLLWVSTINKWYIVILTFTLETNFHSTNLHRKNYTDPNESFSMHIYGEEGTCQSDSTLIVNSSMICQEMNTKLLVCTLTQLMVIMYQEMVCTLTLLMIIMYLKMRAHN